MPFERYLWVCYSYATKEIKIRKLKNQGKFNHQI
ncbi:MAG: hypothetical protein MRERV_49c006 [Mycoplasmataceae bacterium RV_VA103A]|nr:MAG: hypothetical protein MRERV_49c006 [Mycoplasmataceae bacterium RV_VA103A]